MAPLVRRVIAPAAFFAAYLLTGLLALEFLSNHPTVGPIWVPTGIALAAFIVVGPRVWPAILLAAFLVHTTATGSPTAAALVAAGTTAECAVAAALVRRFAGSREVFRHPAHVFRFALLIVPASAALTATFGVAMLPLAGSGGQNAGAAWVTWWLSDLTGAIAITPFVVLWSDHPAGRSGIHVAESITLLILLVSTCMVVFIDLLPFQEQHYPMTILCVPFLMWAAFRLGRRESATAVVVVTLIALYGTLSGDGPFARATARESYLLLQVHVLIWAVMTMALAAVVSEHAHTERVATALATTDPLTELANFRRLTENLDMEIARSHRTGQPFSVVFIDVNGLKRINDTYGHLAGNRALRRVADVLRRERRPMDTAARFGGDEFVVVLPHTDAAGASAQARRVVDLVERDGVSPPVSVATGVAEYPRDGGTTTALLGAADGALYRAKADQRLPRRPASGE